MFHAVFFSTFTLALKFSPLMSLASFTMVLR
uniref:Uncharacterized protein n=1 Tax=Rhizophora mucronata TaxID=61149 RepID=A0A2P2NEV2_RHIMU